MKYLVTGSSGLIGNQLVKNLEDSGHDVFSCYYNMKPTYGIPVNLNLSKLEDIPKIITKIQPEIIIHLAALTDVEKCESDKDLADLINGKSTEIISNEAEHLGCYLIYLSTDYVFDGKKGNYVETDFTNPLNHYGKSKLFGEKAVEQNNSTWCIIRTSTPFGIHPDKKSFPIWVYENLKKNNKINVVDDQFTSPTYVSNLCNIIFEISVKKLEGYFHVSGSTRISRFEFAKKIAKKLNLDLSLLNPVSVNSMPWKAKRPLDSSLNVSKIISSLNPKPLPIEDSLEQYIPQMTHSFSL